MIKNFLKIAFRNLWKRKLISGINLLGMSAAIGCSMLLLLTVFHEFSYDRFHEQGDQLYRVVWEEYRARGLERSVNMPVPARDAMLAESPLIEKASRWLSSRASVAYEGKIYREGVRYIDPDFLEMFSFEILKRNTGNLLEHPNSVLITESAAKRIFGKTDPLGASLKLIVDGVPENLIVTGVMADAPDNSSLQMNLLTNIQRLPGYATQKSSWDNHNHELYLQLHPGADPEAVEKQLASVVEKYLQEEVEVIRKDGAAPNATGEIIRFDLQPVYDIRFDTSVGYNSISKAFPIGLLIIAVFILAIVCINFVNLTLGGSLTRAREVGMRKVLGASRAQLIGQFWGEALMLVFLSLLLGLTLVQWLLPEYNALFRQSLELLHPHIFGVIAIVVILAGLLGGAYPAMVLSRFHAAEVLKGNTQLQKPGRLRNLLVVVQFALSILLISCTIIVFQQLDYLRKKPLGFNEDQVISIPMSSDMDTPKVLDRLRNELAGEPAVHSITASYNNLGMGEDGSAITSVIGFTQGDRQLSTHWNQVDYDYFETLDLPIVQGRSFSRAHPTDTAEAMIINETFAEKIGAAFSIGMTLQMDPPRKVIGVMKDYHFQSLTKPIEALSLGLGSSNGFRYNYLFVKVASENMPATMDMLEKTWKATQPGSIFLASFLNENADRQYKGEEIMVKIFTAAAILAILLSCMGLFGISVMVISQRTREIGIRKVLGASVSDIIGLINGSFMKMIGLGLLLATPLAWWAMRFWLEQYAYSIRIQWWVFLLAGLLTVTIAFLTLSLRSVRAAQSNPVEALRNE